MHQKQLARGRRHEIAQISTRANPRLNLLFISFTGRHDRPYLDPSTRYRCFNPSEAARALGHAAFVTTQVGMDRVETDAFDVITVHRPAWSADLIRLVRDARRSGTRLIADYDDLIFDPAYATQSSMFMRSQDCTSVFATFERNTDALRLFDHFTVSTKPLAEHIRLLHPTATVQVLPNAVSPSLWEGLQRKVFESRSDRAYVGYFPGTATHDRDFAVAAASVANFCRKRRVPLLITGPLNPDPTQFTDVEIFHQPIQPFADMFDTIAQCRIVLAPLVASPFNRSKSHIKLLEATLACSKCVASDIPDMAQHTSIHGFAAAVPGEPSAWADVLDESWDSFNLKEMVVARERLIDDYDSRRVYASLLETIQA